ncbi:MAG: glutaredoxin 3 [Alphaproteobacteria bacterium]|nr:MAG: glutaredoxin 3 [Alphaproteobacteria bacterium]
MVKVEIYSSMMCGFCHRAKQLLGHKGVDFVEIPVDMDIEARATMRSRSGGSNSVPQIFIDGDHVGGCDELYMLEEKGALDVLLAG